MRVQVDKDICIGSGSCEDTCPKVFKVVDGTSVVQADPVPAGEEDDVREAVDGCPVSAIAIVEE